MFLIYFASLFIIMFLIDFYILKKIHTSEFEYMKMKFKFKKSFKESRNMKIVSSIINAFIISTVILFSLHCNFNLFLTFIIAFVLLVLLIYSLYEIYGNILLKKMVKNSRNKKR